MYRLFYTAEAKKQIAKLDERLKVKIKEALEQIAENPLSGKVLSQELKGRFSYRVGDYRIIYRVYHQEITILVLTIGHRRDVYIRIMRKKW